MCQQCVDVVTSHYGHLSAEDRAELLWSATCFPFGSPDQLEAQLIEMKAETDGTLEAAIDFAGRQMDAEFTRFRQRTETKR